MIKEITLIIFSTIVGTFIGYIGAIYIFKVQTKYVAGIKLHNTFNSICAKFYICKNLGYDKPIDIDKELRIALPIQAEAIEGYRFFVPDIKKEQYQKTWNDYYSNAKMCITSEEQLDILKQNIYNILMFIDCK